MSDDHGSPRGLLALAAVGLVVCLGLPALLLGGAIAIGAGAIIVGGGLIFVVAIELGMWGCAAPNGAATCLQPPGSGSTGPTLTARTEGALIRGALTALVS